MPCTLDSSLFISWMKRVLSFEHGLQRNQRDSDGWGRAVTLLWQSLGQGEGGTMSSLNALPNTSHPKYSMRHDWPTDYAHLFCKAVGAMAFSFHYLHRHKVRGTRYTRFLPSVMSHGPQVPAPAGLPWTYIMSTNFRWKVIGQHRHHHFPALLWAS